MNAPLPPSLRHAEQMLPWHVNHTLDAADEARLQLAFAASPQLKAEALWLRSFAALLREDTVRPAPDQGLANLLARLHAEQSGKVVALPARRRGWQKPALALAAGVMLAQAALIGTLLTRQESQGESRPLGAAPLGGPLLQITFRDSTTEAQLRAALVGVDGVLVSGPGQLGVYTVRVGAESIDAALASLQGNPAISSVTRLAPH